MIDIQAIIAKRRDGEKHSREEIFQLAQAAADGAVPDYQITAWLMAAYLRPLSMDETAWLTDAMAKSGDIMDLTGLPKPWLDKHSTGGVGDKTSIALLPILAACGLTIVKMSGRGLGITGGTIDKLASVPGFRTDLDPEQLKAQAKRVGLALTGQTPDLAPADKVLYALRDATTTVGSIPLIVSSVLSKKIAGGAEVIVLDVKYGSGAFMKRAEAAYDLASALKEVSQRLGLKVRLAISDMTQPLGSAVGNSLEVREAIRVLRNEKLDPQENRFRELVLEMAGHSLEAAGLFRSERQGRKAAEESIVAGTAVQKMAEWFEAQGGSRSVVDDPESFPKAPLVKQVAYEGRDGWVWQFDAETVGTCVVRLGGGRKKKEDSIDPRVGMLVHAHVGTRIRSGDPLYTVHAADEASAAIAVEKMKDAVKVLPEACRETPLIRERL